MNTSDYSAIINAINDTNIVKVKMTSDDEKYFSLFDKHIPNNLNRDSKILLFAISNLDVISKIVAKNPDSKYYIFDHTCIFNTINKYYNNGNMYNITIEEVFDPGMKFDCIIMNPPYNKNLHLKILDKVITHLKNDNSICVNLSPISIYQKCVKLKKDFPINISNIYIVSQSEMNQCFNINNWVDGGIIVVDKNATKDFKKFEYIVKYLSIYRKIQNHSIKLKNKFEKNAKNFSLRFYIGCNCCSESKFIMSPKNYDNACLTTQNNHISFINLSSEYERINLYKTVYCKFMRFCCYLDIDVRPWMGNSINPRTGLKGYESEWTDEDFYKFFNITEEEQKHIEEFISQYK